MERNLCDPDLSKGDLGGNESVLFGNESDLDGNEGDLGGN